MTAPTRLGNHALLLAMIGGWGASYAAIKAALTDLTAPGLVAARFTIGALCVLPFALAGGLAALRQAAAGGAITGLALGSGYLLQAYGMRSTTASMGGFIAGLIPILVAAGGWILFRARPGRRGTVGLLLGLAGLVVLVWPTELGSGLNSTEGIVLQLGAALSFACHVLLISHFGARVPLMPFCLWQLALVAVGASAAVALGSGLAVGDAPLFTLRLGALMAFLAVLCTGIGIALQSRVQPRVPPLHVALLFTTQPLFAALTGWATLGESLGARDFAGAALIIAGVVVTSLDRR